MIYFIIKNVQIYIKLLIMINRNTLVTIKDKSYNINYSLHYLSNKLTLIICNLFVVCIKCNFNT